MNSLDIVLSVILLIGIVRGFIKGFIYELAVLGSLYVCYLIGFKIAAIAAVYINKVISVNPTTLHYISLFVAWIGISIGMFFLAKLFEGLIKIVALGIFNKIAGTIFGGLKYAFLISLFLFFFNKVQFANKWINPDLKAESVLYYPILKISNTVLSMKM